MAKFILTPQAERDLEDIWLYIAQDNPRAADKLLDRIETQCQLLAQGLRHYPLSNYLILYRVVAAHGVEIVRVAHGARNILDLL